MSRLENKKETIEVATRFHEIWREGRKTYNGSYEPKWKKIRKDLNFIESAIPSKTVRISEEGVEVDIANTDFMDLPFDYQEENLLAAEVVVNLLKNKKALTIYEIEQFSSVVHDEWLKRNTWAKGGNLDAPYNMLPEEEKAKDRIQVITGMEAMRISRRTR